MASTGVAVVDFGAAGADHASVAVTGQAGILAVSSRTEAWIDPTQAATADHTVDEHIMAASMVGVVCSAIIDGAGFTANAVSNCGRLYGKFNLAWAWS